MIGRILEMERFDWSDWKWRDLIGRILEMERFDWSDFGNGEI